MSRRKGVVEIKEIIVRLRKKQGIRSIRRELRIHRKIIRKVKDIASIHGWLESENGFPTDKQIHTAWFGDKTAQVKEHPLDKYYDDFERWIEEEYTYVVMHELINDRYNCSETTVRRYVQRKFPKKIKPVIRRITNPGEVMEVDFGYLGITYNTSEKRNRKTYVFSARLRHSRKAYREIVFNQKADTFFQCHIHAFEFFGGIPEKCTPDNLKAAIIKASFEDPIVNLSYRSLAEYYDFLISPTLPYHPHHKGGVENDIKYIKKNFWPIAKERQRQKGRDIPYSDELIIALEKWTKEVTEERIIKGVGRSPRDIFENEEKKKLKNLPLFRWAMETWAKCKVEPDCSIQFDKAFYSVPYEHIGKSVMSCGDSTKVRIFLDYAEICSHLKAAKDWEFIRNPNHFPPNLEDYMRTTKNGLYYQAKRIGSYTEEAVYQLFDVKGVDALRQVRAIVFNFTKKFSSFRVEQACHRAIHYNIVSYMSIKNILVKGLDKLSLDEPDCVRSGQKYFRFSRTAEYYNI